MNQNRDEQMKHLGYITTAYERFRATIGRSPRSLNLENVKETLDILGKEVLIARNNLFPVEDVG